MDLTKYKNVSHINVMTLVPSSCSSETFFTPEDDNNSACYDRTERNNNDGLISGKVVDASEGSITIEKTIRGKRHTYEINKRAIAWVHTWEYTEEGINQAKRAKKLHDKGREP